MYKEFFSKVHSLYYVHACVGIALCTRTDLYPRVDLYLHTSEKMIGGYLFFTGFAVE